MKKTAVFLSFLFLLVFTQLAYAVVTQMPNLIGTWTGKTTQVGNSTQISISLTLTAAVPSSVTNKRFSGTLTIGAETVDVVAVNDRAYYKVEIVPADSQVPLSLGGALAWLPGPMILIHGMGYQNTPYKAFILKKTTL